MRQLLLKCFGVLLIGGASWVQCSSVVYGDRVAGGLPVYNDQLRIDGEPSEHWRTRAGERVMFRCVTGLSDYPVIVWTKDGKPLSREYFKYQLISNGNSFLEIPRASLKNEGNYTCTVSNDFGVARKDFHLCVISQGKKEDCPAWWYNWSRTRTG